MEPLPEGTHLIHIGPQKTGSTAIQAAMHAARETLREHGVLYPGPTPKPREAAEVGLGFDRMDGRPNKPMQAWDDLLRQLQEPGHQRVCVSLEAFGRATDEQISRIVSELGGGRPHVIAAARRYDTLMPSQWQERVKSQLRLSYDEWLRVVLGPEDPEDPRWRNLWVPHDTVSLLRRWADVVGEENVTLVVLDENERDRLPRTFESLLGLPTGVLDLEGATQNQSLTYNQTELLRRLNILFHDRSWPRSDYHDLVRKGAVQQMLRVPAAPGEVRIPALPVWARERLVELSDQRIEGLGKLSVRVVGDLEALRVQRLDGPAEVAEADPHVSLETAVSALEGLMVASNRRLREERSALRRRLRAARRRASAASAAAAAATPDGSRSRRALRRLVRGR
ncbi:hypothetical protein ACT8ZV_01735 [Nocardioides sp. MAHUQ-72]|uniref:hypothetical protein n=1 Tax=unclassified Nocardioides TaxID=2615069 RepID=UPI003606197E